MIGIIWRISIILYTKERKEENNAYGNSQPVHDRKK